ncbi:hypothetical protein EMIT036CA2_20808 [Chryseobacterium sp. IT-36CA2]
MLKSALKIPISDETEITGKFLTEISILSLFWAFATGDNKIEIAKAKDMALIVVVFFIFFDIFSQLVE